MKKSSPKPMTQSAARRIQGSVDRNPRPTPQQAAFKGRAMSTAAKNPKR